MNIFTSPWMETDVGLVSPIEALKSANELCFANPDWNSAGMMVLHAMVQTAVVLDQRCPDKNAWTLFYSEMPEDIASWFSSERYLNSGDAPWQDLGHDKTVPSTFLQIDAPQQNTLNLCKDVMRWNENVPSAIATHEALIGLIGTQFWGVSAGNGYFNGPRGNVPMTILLEPEDGGNLWQKVWLNVLSEDEWEMEYPGDASKDFQFPWLLPEDVTLLDPEKSSQLSILWPMPRRWGILVDQDGLVRKMLRRGSSLNYSGFGNHPLTAYSREKPSDPWYPQKTKLDFTFPDWSMVSCISVNNRRPLVLRRIEDREHSRFIRRNPIRVRYFGWALNGKAVAQWNDYVRPLFGEHADSEEWHAGVSNAVNIAEKFKFAIRGSTGTILNSIAKDMKSNYRNSLPTQFIHQVEDNFFQRVQSGDWSGWPESLANESMDILWDSLASRYQRGIPSIVREFEKMKKMPARLSAAKAKAEKAAAEASQQTTEIQTSET